MSDGFTDNQRESHYRSLNEIDWLNKGESEDCDACPKCGFATEEVKCCRLEDCPMKNNLEENLEI